MNFIYIDFEYIEEPDRSNRHLVCGVAYDAVNKTGQSRTLMNEFNREIFIDFLNLLNLNETFFVGWAISGAEIPCLIQLMGVEWVKKLNG